MLKILIILVITIIIASLLFTFFKKLVKIALFICLVLIVFMIITGIIYPKTNIFQKGKDYILGKSESMLEEGKEKVTAYVVVEANQTINKAKEKILQGIERD